LEAQAGRIGLEDIELIARGQQASEDALAREANRILFCDTDLLATRVWSETLFGSCPDWIATAARERRYPLTLLCDVDVPFVPDPVRYLPNARQAFFERAEAALRASDRRYVRISGDWESRFQTAVSAVESLQAGSFA
jgi:NadR type nicotinamide-nucleotide adenylyltransferase